jgi:hypothetical protein
MLRGLRWLALAGVLTAAGVAGAALIGPSAALACDHSGSAVSIYTDCVPKASGGHHPKPAKHPQQTTTYYTGPPAPVVHVSTKAKHVIANSGKDKNALTDIVSNLNLVDTTHLKPVLASAPVHGASLGSAVDLGTGPTVFFALLLGTVLVLLGAGGVRSWRNRHRV